jgi:hypothetical protein
MLKLSAQFKAAGVLEHFALQKKHLKITLLFGAHEPSLLIGTHFFDNKNFGIQL